jgi:hypothetical protein
MSEPSGPGRRIREIRSARRRSCSRCPAPHSCASASMPSPSSTRMEAFQILSTIRQLGNDPPRLGAEREENRRLVALGSPRSRGDHRTHRSRRRAGRGSRQPIAPGRRRAARARSPSTSPPPDATAPDGRGGGSTTSWTRSRWRHTMSVGAWLTVESRSSIEARRLEGLLFRVRVATVAAPERGAARRWCARTAPPR